MSITEREEIDWSYFERQFGGGSGGSGGHDEGGDGGHKPERPENNDMSAAVAFGGLAGMLTSFPVAVEAVNLADARMLKRYALKHHMAVPSYSSAVESGIEAKALNKYVDGAAAVGPFLVLTALGMAIGKKIKNRYGLS